MKIKKNCIVQSSIAHLSEDYISKLVSESVLLEEEEAKEAGRLGFMARALVQATLPHSDPKSNEFVRKNGNFTLEMMAPSSVGLPYGSIPRIILAWITTEAVKKDSRVIFLGENLSIFLQRLGFENNGGVRGDITRVKEQLALCDFAWTVENALIIIG